MNDRLLTQRVQQDIRIDGVLGFGEYDRCCCGAFLC